MPPRTPQSYGSIVNTPTGWNVQRVIPQPLSVAVGTDRLVYRFLHSGGNPSRIVFELDPQGPGRVVGQVGGTGADRIDISQIVYP